jgi:hypothetical protein
MQNFTLERRDKDIQENPLCFFGGSQAATFENNKPRFLKGMLQFILQSMLIRSCARRPLMLLNRLFNKCH